MTHDNNQTVSSSIEQGDDEHKNTLQKLADAHNEIADLKMQIAWLERSYE